VDFGSIFWLDTGWGCRGGRAGLRTRAGVTARGGGVDAMDTPLRCRPRRRARRG